MKIDLKTVSYIANLSKLHFTPEKEVKMAKEFESILNHFESIDNIDLSDVSLDYTKDSFIPYMRKDEAFVFEDKEKLFQNVKCMEGSSIKVPKILE